MAQCIHCGTETQLYSANVPICPGCDFAQDAKREQNERYIAEARQMTRDARQMKDEAMSMRSKLIE